MDRTQPTAGRSVWSETRIAASYPLPAGSWKQPGIRTRAAASSLRLNQIFQFVPIPREAFSALPVREIRQVAGHRGAAPELDILHRLLARPHAFEEVLEVIFGPLAILLELHRLPPGLL